MVVNAAQLASYSQAKQFLLQSGTLIFKKKKIEFKDTGEQCAWSKSIAFIAEIILIFVVIYRGPSWS
jgi:hypothetical protein